MAKEGTKRITVSLKKEILYILDDFCKKNHGLDRSKGVTVAIKKLQDGKR